MTLAEKESVEVGLHILTIMPLSYLRYSLGCSRPCTCLIIIITSNDNEITPHNLLLPRQTN